MKRITLAALYLLIFANCNATTYETAEEGTEHQWRIYDQRPKGASISNIYDETKDSQVIEFNSRGTRNGFVIGGWRGKEAWKNSEEMTAQWSMSYSERFVVYFHINTKKGARYLYYTAVNKNKGISNSGRYIHHGLGKEAKNGSWQSFSRDLQADLQEFETDNEITAVNGFFIRGSGKVDDIKMVHTASITEPVGNAEFTKEQRLIADQFISIFENGTAEIKYDYAANIGDGRGITAGRAGFTSATGDMLIVINKYTKLKPNNSLAQYTDELAYLVDLRYNVGDRKGSASTKNLGGLVEVWKEHSQYQAFRDIQDEVVDEMYFDTAVEKAKSIGVTLPLSLLCLYDANIMHGESGLENLVNKTNQQMKAKGDFDEISWITKFNAVRKDIMLSDSSWKYATTRVDELDDLIESKNYPLSPFKMVIENYEDETHYLPVY